MIADFTTLAYLKTGTPRQRYAYEVLSHEGIFNTLSTYDPILVGTIPINIDLPTSDLDIVCCFTDKELFKITVTEGFAKKNWFCCERIFIERH